ncbi:MAG TPA: hypothetical protein VF613_25660 [Longimicrobium sp.]|jgi:hypothetical protein
MRSTVFFALVGAVAIAGCQTVPFPRGTLAHTPCNPNVIAGVLNSGEPLTRDERRYLERCGIRFVSPPSSGQVAAVPADTP